MPGASKGASEINGMKVTDELRELYKGRESLLRYRSLYPSHCHKVFDAMGLCQMGRVPDDECYEVFTVFETCAREFQQKQLLAARLQRK